jgi:hypothetical protein
MANYTSQKTRLDPLDDLNKLESITKMLLEDVTKTPGIILDLGNKLMVGNFIITTDGNKYFIKNKNFKISPDESYWYKGSAIAAAFMHQNKKPHEVSKLSLLDQKLYHTSTNIKTHTHFFKLFTKKNYKWKADMMKSKLTLDIDDYNQSKHMWKQMLKSIKIAK